MSVLSALKYPFSFMHSPAKKGSRVASTDFEEVASSDVSMNQVAIVPQSANLVAQPLTLDVDQKLPANVQLVLTGSSYASTTLQPYLYADKDGEPTIRVATLPKINLKRGSRVASTYSVSLTDNIQARPGVQYWLVVENIGSATAAWHGIA